MFGDSKKTAALIVAKMAPGEDREDEERDEEDSPGLRAAAEDLLLAVRNEDPVGVMNAMRAGHELIDAEKEAEESEPEEPEEGEEDPEGFAKGGRIKDDPDHPENWRREKEEHLESAARARELDLPYTIPESKRRAAYARVHEREEREKRHLEGLHGPGYAQGGPVGAILKGLGAGLQGKEYDFAKGEVKKKEKKPEVDLSKEGDPTALNELRRSVASRVGSDPDRVPDFADGGKVPSMDELDAIMKRLDSSKKEEGSAAPAKEDTWSSRVGGAVKGHNKRLEEALNMARGGSVDDEPTAEDNERARREYVRNSRRWERQDQADREDERDYKRRKRDDYDLGVGAGKYANMSTAEREREQKRRSRK